MLRIVEAAHRTDTGRQRSSNEDSYFARAPVFAVADGMGGAQAGEVASQIAVEQFEAAAPPEQSPEAYLRRIAEEANDRIHTLAEEDTSRSGMGTTLTAALVEGDEVSLAHVGDSRAYLYRDGDLRLLTSDHSLVEELRRQGRLTDEQASEHPQRSIITRALGPEPSVEVDTMTYRAKPGDVYLLCSDGLTTMVKEEVIARTLASARSLDAAVGRLVRAANDAGGKDNITVLAFRLDEAEVPAEKEGVTLVGPAAEEAGLTAERVRAGAPTAERRRPAHPPAERRRRPRRRVVVSLAIFLVVAGIVGGGIYAGRQVYFLGTDSGGRLALYRGLPYDLPLGIHLYSEVYAAPVLAADLPAARRGSATDHTLRSHADAVSLLQFLERSARPPQGSQPGRGASSGRGSSSRQGAGSGGGKSGGGGRPGHSSH